MHFGEEVKLATRLGVATETHVHTITMICGVELNRFPNMCGTGWTCNAIIGVAGYCE